jgi:hypothetical protein
MVRVFSFVERPDTQPGAPAGNFEYRVVYEKTSAKQRLR